MVSENLRTGAFLKERLREMENQRLHKEGAHGEDQRAEDDDDERDSDERHDKEHSYDPDVISNDDILWTATLHVLASSPYSEEESK